MKGLTKCGLFLTLKVQDISFAWTIELLKKNSVSLCWNDCKAIYWSHILEPNSCYCRCSSCIVHHILVAGKLKICVILAIFTFVLLQENISGNFYIVLAEFTLFNRDLVSLCVKHFVLYLPVTCLSFALGVYGNFVNFPCFEIHPNSLHSSSSSSIDLKKIDIVAILWNVQSVQLSTYL